MKDNAGLHYHFNGPENVSGYKMLSEISKNDGSRIQFKYNGRGELLYIIDSRNQQINVDTDLNGYIKRIWIYTDGNQLDLVRYKYDTAGNMVEMTDAMDASERFYYNGHLLIQSTDPNGINFFWEYDGKGDDARCIHTWGDKGVLEYHIEYGDGVTRTKNSLGQITEYYYDDRKLIYKIIDANGGITRQQYNEFEELDMVINPEGGVRKTVYNEFGKVAKSIDENGQSTLYYYDDSLNLIELISPGGMSQKWKYNEAGLVVERTMPDGNKLQYHYEENSLRHITDSEKQQYSLSYNKSGDMEEVIFPNGLSRRWKYDQQGRLTQSTDLKGNTARFHYDRTGNLTRLDEPDGNVHHFSYDPSGNMIRAKDQIHDIGFTYGPMGILKSRTQNGRTVRFVYDRYTHLRAIQNEGGEKYAFEVDGLGQVISETGFDGIHRSYVRDGVGRVVKVIRPNDRWTDISYDPTGNIVREEQYDGTYTAYRYNADSVLIEALNKEGSLKFDRDKKGNIIKESRTDGHFIDKAYNKNGLCTNITSSLGADIRQEFDKDGNLMQLQSGDHWQANWKRDNVGLEIHRQLTGGVSVLTSRDNFGREISKSIGINNTRKSSKRYLWGMGNRLQGINDEISGTHINFEYDVFDNLTRADYTESGQIKETIYRTPDVIGNLYEDHHRSDRRYDKGGRLLEDLNYNYHYDCEGNLCFKEFKKHMGYSSLGKEALEKKYDIKFKATATGWLYNWSADGMLLRVVNPQQGKVHFGYDALGRRTYKEVKNRRTCWLWDGNVPLHEWTELKEEPRIDIVTWVFEEGSFVPCARLTETKSESVITDRKSTRLNSSH